MARTTPTWFISRTRNWVRLPTAPPGFINAHCHLELSHLHRLIPEKTGLVDFVFKVVTERHHLEEKILDAIAKAEAKMIENGIVAVGDICNNLLTYTQKRKDNLSYYNFIEASGWLPSVSAERFSRALDLYNQFSLLPGNNKSAIIPHAPYSVSEDLLNLMMPYFTDNTVSIHNQETSHEDEFFEVVHLLTEAEIDSIPDGLKKIAQNVHEKAVILSKGLNAEKGLFFDTISIKDFTFAPESQ